jgi:hypothetical protein
MKITNLLDFALEAKIICDHLECSVARGAFSLKETDIESFNQEVSAELDFIFKKITQGYWSHEIALDYRINLRKRVLNNN